MSGQRLQNLETINRSMRGNRHGRVGVIGGNDDFSNSRTGISRGALMPLDKPPLLIADRSSSIFSITELPAPRLMPVLLFEKSSFPPITPTRPCLFPLIDLL
jgi:hypothetical protein